LWLDVEIICFAASLRYPLVRIFFQQKNILAEYSMLAHFNLIINPERIQINFINRKCCLLVVMTDF
jgi:hypothetical protein